MTDDEYAESVKKLGVPQKVRPQTPSIFVTASADNKLADLEQAMQWMLLADTDDAKQKAYAHLGACRKAIYEHIENLEARCGERRTVLKRF